MRDHASIAPTFWTRGTGKRLRGDTEAQLVALYLMSSPATSMVGIFHLALPTMCHETGLDREGALKGLARCTAEAFAFWDEDEEIVFIPALARHQVGERMSIGKNGNPDKRILGVKRALAPFKGHRFYDMFLERYADAYLLTDLFDEAPSEDHRRGPHVRARGPVLSCLDPVLPDPDQPDRSPPAKPKSPDAPRAKSANPVHLPTNWAPGEKLVQMLAVKWDIDPRQVLRIVPEFVHFWTENPKGKTKRRNLAGWDESFRRWVNRVATDGQVPPLPKSATPAAAQRAAAEHAQRRQERIDRMNREAEADLKAKGIAVGDMPANLAKVLGGIG
jgi:hypothetical protein